VLIKIGNFDFTEVWDGVLNKNVTEYVCHTTSIENVRKSLECGSLLSATKARNLAVEELRMKS